MESRQFARIAKSLRQPPSRRTATMALAVGGLGAVLTRLTTSGAAAAGCRRNGRTCQSNGQCGSEECHRDVCRRDRERERE
jgi:hypothetical protein